MSAGPPRALAAALAGALAACTGLLGVDELAFDLEPDASQEAGGSAGAAAGTGGGAGDASAGSGGSGGGAGGSGGEAGGAGAGPGCSPAGLSDEFDEPSDLAGWNVLSVPGKTLFTTLDVDTSAPGKLAIVPSHDTMWFQQTGVTRVAPFVYRRACGNFSAVTRVTVRHVADAGPPTVSAFSGAGLLARAAPPVLGAPENWVLFYEGTSVSDGGPTSRRILAFAQQGETRGPFTTPGAATSELILCRVGNTFYTYFRFDSQQPWVMGRPSWLDPPQVDAAPPDMDLGLTAQAPEQAPGSATLAAEFDWLHVHVPATEAK